MMIIDQAEIRGTELSGQVAVVTGAGQGIGRETARVLAHLGATVAIVEIKDSGQETEALIRSEGGRARFFQTDVSDPTSMEQLQRQVHALFGDADILVNNAITFTTKPLLEHSVEEWDRVLAVNLRGAFLGIKVFLPAMLKRHRGVILTMERPRTTPGDDSGTPYSPTILCSPPNGQLIPSSRSINLCLPNSSPPTLYAWQCWWRCTKWPWGC